MRRAAVLRDDRDRFIGRTTVAEQTFIIVHEDRYFIRTDKGVRLSGGGIGVIFDETDPAIRMKLDPV